MRTALTAICIVGSMAFGHAQQVPALVKPSISVKVARTEGPNGTWGVGQRFDGKYERMNSRSMTLEIELRNYGKPGTVLLEVTFYGNGGEEAEVKRTVTFSEKERWKTELVESPTFVRTQYQSIRTGRKSDPPISIKSYWVRVLEGEKGEIVTASFRKQ